MNSQVSLPKQVTIVEVGPRDGLQNIVGQVPVDIRIQFINKLSAIGLQYIEAGSFVSPNKVPQMDHTDQVLQGIQRYPGCAYPVLVPNIQGLNNAISAGADYIAIFGSASSTFCQKNIGCSIDESLARFKEIIHKAQQHHIRVRGYLSCVLGCPYEGHVAAEDTAILAEKFMNMGCYEVSLGDTIGVGTPGNVVELLDATCQRVPVSALAVHFHDTYGQALANIYAALQCGISVVDTAIAGLGGCPYAPGASGNVATEDVLYMLNGLHINTGVNFDKLIELSHFICETVGCVNHSKVTLAMQNNT